jgi:ribosomal protein S18 acetylase RimI-like enzyme
MPDESRDHLVFEEIQIRPACTEDQQGLVELFRQSIIEGQVRDNDTGADLDHLHDGYFADEGASSFWVALYDGQLIGMIGVQRTSKSSAEIRRLRVHDRYRRRGLGTRLMEEALRFCQAHGYLKIVLDVRTERAPAIALFEKFGFMLDRTREIGGRKMHDFYMDLYKAPEEGC